MSETNGPSPASRLREEYNNQKDLFAAQPIIVQRFLEAQAAQLANALGEHLAHVRFTLPDRVIARLPNVDQPASMAVPPGARDQPVGGVRNRLLRKDVRDQLRHRLNELEQSPDSAIAYSAGLIRFTTAIHLIYNMLPSGRSVTYRASEDDEIPSIPVDDGLEPDSAITAATDAIAEEGRPEEGRAELLVPYVPAARRFYLPQWVAFDDAGKLLVGSVKEAEAHVASMQRYLTLVHLASSLAPYMIADEEYHKKRYGMLGQLINQGRALAHYKTVEIIRMIKGRAAAGTLNRGLSLSLPYFDDQELAMAVTFFEIIPAGRIMFVPAFVVRAAREEAAKTAQDTRFNPSTRRHLLEQLKLLEDAFYNPGGRS